MIPAEDKGEGSQKKLKRLQEIFSDDLTELFLRFYQYVIPIFEERNVQLQRREPQIHVLYDIYYGLYEEILTAYIDPEMFEGKVDIADISLASDDIQHVEGWL